MSKMTSELAKQLGFKAECRRNTPCYYKPANNARWSWVYCFIDDRENETWGIVKDMNDPNLSYFSEHYDD